MECGVPFCHNGCPLQPDPDWNDLVYRDRWREAIDHCTDQQLPRAHGQAPARAVRGGVRARDPRGRRGHDQQIEVSIINRAFEEGWVAPARRVETGHTVAVFAAGPSGLAAAQQLPRRHDVPSTSATRPAAAWCASRPDFNIEKWSSAPAGPARRRGVKFAYGVDVGVDISADELRERHEAVVLATGSARPRDLPVPGASSTRAFAMDYLYGRNRWVANGEVAIADHCRRAST